MISRATPLERRHMAHVTKGVGAHLLSLQRRTTGSRSLDVERDAAFDHVATMWRPVVVGNRRPARSTPRSASHARITPTVFRPRGTLPFLAALSHRVKVRSDAEAHVGTGERRQL